MQTNLPRRCHHIKMNGTQCGSPAMRSERFCFFHLNTSPLNCEIKSSDLRPDENFVLPVLEDATSIQLAISQVMAFLLRGYIEVKKARVLLSACKLASDNLKRMDSEKPLPSQMLVDVRTVPTTPMGASDLWSATGEGCDPGLDSNAEPGAAQSQDSEPTAPPTQIMNQRHSNRISWKVRDRTSEAAKEEQKRAFRAQFAASLKKAEEQAVNEPQPDKSTAALLPGTIQACEGQKEYVI